MQSKATLCLYHTFSYYKTQNKKQIMSLFLSFLSWFLGSKKKKLFKIMLNNNGF